MATPVQEQLEEINKTFQAMNPKIPEQRQALADKISASTLPRYHKEALMLVLLEGSAEKTVLGLHVLRRQEEMRHADSLLQFETKVLGWRQAKADSTAPSPTGG